MMELAALGLEGQIGLFGIAATAILFAGLKMARTADRLADRTGIGEALFGGILLGGSTSLPGIVTSVTAAAEGAPELAVSNAVGGIAAQTFFLVIADMTYRKANLEHAAASTENIVQAGLLVALLSLVLMAPWSPDVEVFGLHPISVLIFLGYFFGMRLTVQSRESPMWLPRHTVQTKADVPREPKGGAKVLWLLWLRFAALALTLAVAGYATAKSGIAIAAQTGLSESVVGALMTAIATSLPELVTTLAIVRQGALTLAVGGVIGGNMFDMLFIASADAAYRDGSIYHQISQQPYFLAGLTALMTAVILLGLLRREKFGLANIGFESLIVLLLYLGGTAVLVTT